MHIMKVKSPDLSTYRICQCFVFLREGRRYIFCQEVFFRMYLLLALELLLIASLGFIVVDEIKKHVFGFTQSKYAHLPSVLTSPSTRFSEK